MFRIFKNRNLNDASNIVDRITKLRNRKRPEKIYQYFYAYMIELKNGGLSLASVGKGDFFVRNWRFIKSNYKIILLKIYDWFLNNKNEFEELLRLLSSLVNNDNFMKWVDDPGFRFLSIKSLHDSDITSIKFNFDSQKLVITVNSRFAIDYIPFNDMIELHFETEDFNISNVNGLNEKISENQTLIWEITPYFEDGKLKVDVDYTLYYGGIDDGFQAPDLNFVCKRIDVKNV